MITEQEIEKLLEQYFDKESDMTVAHKAGKYSQDAETLFGCNIHPKTASFHGFMAGHKSALQNNNKVSDVSAEDVLEKYPHVTGTTEGDESRLTIKRGDLFKCMEEYASIVNENLLQELGEKEVMIKAFADIQDMFEKRDWIMEGRGCYPYNDDRYKEEVRYLYNDFAKLKKKVWKNIKTKTFEYREKIIADYKKSIVNERKDKCRCLGKSK